MVEMKDDKNELPSDFDNEIHKWALECNLIIIIEHDDKVKKYLVLFYFVLFIVKN